MTNVNPLSKKHSEGVQNTSMNTEELENEKLLRYAKTFNNIFCIGDACLTSINEEKTVYPLK